ncbi:putative toxin-antitoxin system toxin component, PIN family [Dyadobacter fanqingshengii]|uniref:Toxin-antitoxin system toxin component, PIN family n=1 Tax=Dyadobacter fanqingshengii TaxID=2906443 RepID=A0A9X1PBF7_9BACT|nr:putative toxin-antitoxin system toxin component, PIN family [Dyadobacter fanqingshengii]MCF0041891.1 putative toxin-antitoxin system toxin component, PIN family [Dyadobacter fanqingshengii]MCF2504867.1 putative toxin-antitoxin system toxin component, PIN family [Dyadobacter fanqingshengii]USJ36402.1 putative toxin-antitoxin system toxin component, PIN family [Dyadobacter fanqingshengii]
MQKLVVDTNVLVSALIQRSYPYLILQGVLSNPNLQICLSEPLLREYMEVLNRKKFARFPDFIVKAQFVLTEIERVATMYNPKTKLDILSDKDDNKLLELAAESKADFLITGNHTDFTIEIYENTQIVNPKIYWTDYISLAK